jgi:serine/threonine protein kinase/WD40 repeat protein
MSEPYPSLEKFLFEAALGKSSEAERAAFLESVYRGYPALRARLDLLLEGQFQAEGFLPGGAKKVEQKPTPPAAEDETTSTFIGRYKLLEKIGEGGFGEVWMAEQREPVKRRVALKIIKLGMDTKQVVARFEAERQALAMMDHPNIAKVFDAGATDSGRPYFVMELVRGVRITEYCDAHRLPTLERLKLFNQVCRAIQHAHQKGIIHRDIKPSNILVTLNDPELSGVPKVIDFGIAKATQQELTEKTVFTQFRQFLGTPAYVSPEQAAMTSLDIDTRSDIYSLGVLLYELLTSKTPFDSAELMAASLDEVRHRIREMEPVRPSTRLSALARDELTTTAQCRGTEPPKLISQVRGDLDWIVMKSLEKDRARRYETANGLARDIERHLSNEPVLARPPSRLYEFQKTVRRHWVGFTAVGAVVVALSIGALVSTLQAVRATRAEADQAKQKLAAQQFLYNSLVAEARATRQARRVGYRDQVFTRLRQAKALDVPEKNLAELRREAEACLGDFVGLTPLTLTNFSTNIVSGCLAPSGRLAALALGDHTIHLHRLPSGNEIARLTHTDRMVLGLCFNHTSDRLYAVTGLQGAPSLPIHRISVWAADSGGAWREIEDRVVPGATRDLFVTESGVFDIIIGFFVRGPPVVAKIIPGSPAEKCHLQIGDEIVGFKGIPVGNFGELTNLIEKCGVQAATITVQRGSDRIELSATATQTNRLGAEFAPNAAVFRLFNVETKAFVPGYAVTNPVPPTGGVNYCASGDGRVLAVAGLESWDRDLDSSALLTVYDWKDGARIAQLRLTSEGVLDLGDDGKYLCHLTDAGGAIYTLPSLEPVVQFKESYFRYRSTRHGNMIAMKREQQNRIRLWDLAKREETALLDEPEETAPFAFTPTGDSLLTAGARHARLYRLRTPEKLELLPHALAVPEVAFSPDGLRLASAGRDRVLRVSDTVTGRTLWETNDLPGGGQCVTFSPDGRLLAIGYLDSEIVWIRDAQTGERLARLGEGLTAPDYAARFSPDGRYLATAGNFTNGLRVWVIEREAKGALEAKLLKSWAGGAASVAFAPDSRSLAFTTPDRDLYLWDFESTAQPRRLASRVFGWWQGFTPDGRQSITEDASGDILALEVGTGKRVSTGHLQDLGGNATGGQPSPDGTRVALALAAPTGNHLGIWDTKSGKLLYWLPADSGTALCVAWSQDSQRLAVSFDNGNIVIWELETVGQILAQLGLTP